MVLAVFPADQVKVLICVHVDMEAGRVKAQLHSKAGTLMRDRSFITSPSWC